MVVRFAVERVGVDEAEWAAHGGQKLDRQVDALATAGCRWIFADKKSGKDDLRPELTACHAFLQPGDTLAVPALDRYARSLKDLVNMVGEPRRREIGFCSLHERLDTTTPGGRLVFHVFRRACRVHPRADRLRYPRGPGPCTDRREQIGYAPSGRRAEPRRRSRCAWNSPQFTP
ncbi:recombinase family protein [Streptomyces sp. Ag109_G2-15]|uniref:recombinase family protein n=1 Tax=Streptomyces sp. Ag109_G2-15 TaxID=1938850 RepID=UPI00211D08BD|nr:recombinase family protein [Streptomyces sp. Ag109_G2-15]